MSSVASIRLATAADLTTLGRLGALLVRMHHDLDPARFIAAAPQTERLYGSFLGTRIEDPTALVLVAEMETEVIGYAYAEVEGHDYMALRGPAGVLHDLMVEPDQRRNGIGTMLMERVLAELKARGAPRVVLSTAVRNEAAQRLFERFGFRPTMVEMMREMEANST